MARQLSRWSRMGASGCRAWAQAGARRSSAWGWASSSLPCNRGGGAVGTDGPGALRMVWTSPYLSRTSGLGEMVPFMPAQSVARHNTHLRVAPCLIAFEIGILGSWYLVAKFGVRPSARAARRLHACVTKKMVACPLGGPPFCPTECASGWPTAGTHCRATRPSELQ